MRRLPYNYLVAKPSALKHAPRECFVYAWWRPSQGYLYVGKTVRGLKRFISHHVIGKAEIVRKTDELHIWYCEKEELNQLEFKMTELLVPFFQTKAGLAKRGVFGIYGKLRIALLAKKDKELKAIHKEFC